MDPKDPQHNGLVDLIDARTRERTLRVRLPRLPKPAFYVYADVVFPPNGGDLLVRQVPGEAPNGPASPVYRVDGKTGAITDRLLVGEYTSDFYASATADRERFFLTSQRDNRTWELDAERLGVERSWPVGDSGRGGQSRRPCLRSGLRRQAGSGCSIWTPGRSGSSAAATTRP